MSSSGWVLTCIFFPVSMALMQDDNIVIHCKLSSHSEHYIFTTSSQLIGSSHAIPAYYLARNRLELSQSVNVKVDLVVQDVVIFLSIPFVDNALLLISGYKVPRLFKPR